MARPVVPSELLPVAIHWETLRRDWWGAQGFDASGIQDQIDRYVARLMAVDDAADTHQFDDVPEGQQPCHFE